MKTILFPTDFSENAIHASHYAAMIANIYEANIVLLNIDYIPMVAENHHSQVVQSAVINSLKTSQEELEQFKNQFIDDTQIAPSRVSTRVVYGFPADKIIEEAQIMNVDMIVMGTKGANNLLDKWLGTNAQKVAKNAHCPVFVIPSGAKIVPPQKIMYAADFQKDEKKATQKLLNITKPFEAFCKVIHIHDVFEPLEGTSIKEEVKAMKVNFENDDIFIRSLNREDIIEGLEAYIDTFKPDILALAIHEKSFLEQFFNESVTKHFIQDSQLPILTFRK
jgi:nucleotide-binding universal stress UspA family protein